MTTERCDAADATSRDAFVADFNAEAKTRGLKIAAHRKAIVNALGERDADAGLHRQEGNPEADSTLRIQTRSSRR